MPRVSRKIPVVTFRSVLRSTLLRRPPPSKKPCFAWVRAVGSFCWVSFCPYRVSPYERELVEV
jgi:hypothetical protein